MRKLAIPYNPSQFRRSTDFAYCVFVSRVRDTHSFLWFIADDPKLSKKAKEYIENEENQCLLSIASVWEMAIKSSIGKLKFTKPIEKYIPDSLKENEIELLPMSIEHAMRVATLPFHHRDPFDRLIISQAICQQLPIVTCEQLFQKYLVEVIW